ncbi:MAG TPA: IS66 family transposase [Planctomycetaceae bacterium]|nr:IS66 family transposase [Planctomycetaceae bacterium]
MRIAELERAVTELRELLGRNSKNSNKPPSSDPPGSSAKRRILKPKGKRKRGGQKGHRGSRRELVPVDEVDRFVELYPAECESCWQPLPKTPDVFAKRYQQVELEPHAPVVTEYRRHAVVCACGYKTRATYDASVIPQRAFGPRLTSVVALLTGVYHLSRRQTVRLLQELLGVRMSLGSVSAIERRVSEAIKPQVDEVLMVARAAEVKHTDGTSWRRSAALWSLWTLATAAVTVFKIVANGKRDTLKGLLGNTSGILVSDRATALKFWPMERRQVCWAHLLRKFVSFSERDGPTGESGKELLDYATLLFTYWGKFRRGELSREALLTQMAPVRPLFEAALERAVAMKMRGLSGSCADLLQHRQALWTFLDNEDVEPTNNHAERELRSFVLWRRRSFGTQSEHGDRFAERIMTVAHTARKQGRDILTFLHACCTHSRGHATPSLFAG